MNAEKPPTRTWLWLLLAFGSGNLLVSAYLYDGRWAWGGVVLLGVCASWRPLTRRQWLAVCTLAQLVIGVRCFGFLYYGVPLYGATVVYQAASGLAIGVLSAPKAGSTVSSLRLALAWTGIEYLHQLGPVGFPLFLGGTQVQVVSASALSVVGACGLSGLLVGTGAAFAGLLQLGSRPRGWPIARAVGWATALTGIIGLGQFQPGLELSGEPLEVTLVQGGLTNELYLRSVGSSGVRAEVEEHYFDLAEQALASGVDLVLLPESALHRRIAVSDDGSTDLPLFRPTPHAQNGAQVVTGAYRESWAAPGVLATYNSALLFDATDPFRALAWADKTMLVPITERGLDRGQTDGTLALRNGTLGILICYESMYPRLARQRAARADVLAVLTNDAGFHDAPITTTHARQGWSRAIETGRPLLRVAQAGISFSVDHRGTLASRLGLFETGLLETSVQPMSGWTWFTWLGHWFGLAAFLVSGIWALLAFRQRHSPARVQSDVQTLWVSERCRRS